jgi:hypothetical protein
MGQTDERRSLPLCHSQVKQIAGVEMSANNWTQCPRCYAVNKEKAQEKDKLASEAYGKVSPEVFDELREEARAFRKRIAEDDNFCSTMREDWGIGIQDMEFSVAYSCSCKVCGFSFMYNHKEKV